MKWFVAFALLLIVLPCRAQPAMMFNSVDQYIERAEGIWILEIVEELPQRTSDGNRCYVAKVIQTLKGDIRTTTTLTVTSVFNPLTVHSGYLFFGFNSHHDGSRDIWMDNGNVTPIPILSSAFYPDPGKPLEGQLKRIFALWASQLDAQIKVQEEKRDAIRRGLK